MNLEGVSQLACWSSPIMSFALVSETTSYEKDGGNGGLRSLTILVLIQALGIGMWFLQLFAANVVEYFRRAANSSGPVH